MKFNLLKQFIQQGPLTVHITGACMHRVVPPGSDVRLEESRLYWPGEIIVCNRGDDELVTHRFLGYLRGRRDWLAITRADNARQADAPVALRHVLGRVTHVDGRSFRPEPMDRIRACTAWFPAIKRIIVRSLSKSATVLEDA